MAETTERLEIVTPEKKVFSGDVRFVVIPGELGQLGILANHAPLMSGIKVGLVKVEQEGKTFKIAVSGGFVEVAKNRVTILADTAEREDQIDRERAEKAKERAEKRLSEKQSDLDIKRAEMALQRALNRLKAAQ
ncbi:MAG: ATP synthase F0F1 subunit epsilon [Peptococcaceae bacterium BICA1-7]|nr:MAG: ATP synthase F0F1 subunit epsilon [Peptococcaceae bacterium BICA1-7]